MHDLSNWAVLIGDAGIVIGGMTAILNFMLKDFLDNQRIQMRYMICSFAGDLRNGVKKTRQEFEAIFEIFDKYEKIIKKLKLTNGFVNSEMAYIKEQYKLLK